jgi:hypothetical protein
MVIVARTSRNTIILIGCSGVMGILIFGVVGPIVLYAQDFSQALWPLIAWASWGWLLGGLVIFATVRAWHDGGRGLGLDDEGIHWWRTPLARRSGHVVLRWEEICGARAVYFQTEGEPQPGLLVGLEPSASNPGRGALTRVAVKALETPVPWPNVALIQNCNWEWDAWEAQRQIEEMLNKRGRTASETASGTGLSC